MIRFKTHPELVSLWHGFAAGALIFLAIGLFVGHRIWAPGAEIEPKAASQVQADGSRVLARQPDAHALPAHATPAGASVQRVGKIIARAKQNPALVIADTKNNSSTIKNTKKVDADCPPVTIDWSLVRQKDGERMIVSSKDGEILGGVDIPVAPFSVATPHRWAAGGSYGLAPQAYGAWLERDLWRLRFGIEANRTRQGDVEGRVRLGITF